MPRGTKAVPKPPSGVWLPGPYKERHTGRVAATRESTVRMANKCVSVGTSVCSLPVYVVCARVCDAFSVLPSRCVCIQRVLNYLLLATE